MAAKSPEARRVLRDLNKELAAASESRGQKLVWSAQESAILDQISSILDRKAELIGLYEEARSVKNKLRLSQELRLLERAAASLVSQIRTDLPAAESYNTARARRAARARWDRPAATVVRMRFMLCPLCGGSRRYEHPPTPTSAPMFRSLMGIAKPD